MNDSPLDLSAVGELLDHQLTALFQRMTGLSLDRIPTTGPLSCEARSLAISTSGDRCLTFLLCADWQLWQAVATHMNHGSPVPEDHVFPYVGELFNMICGRVVATINQTLGCHLRFSVPSLVQGFPAPPADFYYRCDLGHVNLAVTDTAPAPSLL